MHPVGLFEASYRYGFGRALCEASSKIEIARAEDTAPQASWFDGILRHDDSAGEQVKNGPLSS